MGSHTVVPPQIEEHEEPQKSIQQIIDEHDKNCPVFYSPYAQRIVRGWLQNENRFRCTSTYLEGQTEIKPYMRELLIDWLIDMNCHFSHHRETLYLCVNIVDRYVNYTIRNQTDLVVRSEYQLVGLAAYYIACKYEEIYFPDMNELLVRADNAYTEAKVKAMELKIVNTLKFDLSVPTTNKFLHRFLRVGFGLSKHILYYMFIIVLLFHYKE